MTPASGDGGGYDPVTRWWINSIRLIYDNETRRWCMRTHVYIPGVGNRIYIEPLGEPLPLEEKKPPEPRSGAILPILPVARSTGSRVRIRMRRQ